MGRRDLRKLDEGFCRWFVSEVGVGDMGCFRVLPLRLMGTDEDEAIGRSRYCRCMFLVVWMRQGRRYKCHCDSWMRECQKGILPCPCNSKSLAASPRPSFATYILYGLLYLMMFTTECVFQNCIIESSFRINCPSISQTNKSAKDTFPEI